MDSSQIQTPPPTRDASSRRKRNPTTTEQRTPISSMSVAITTPVENVGFQGSSLFQTPSQYSQLQFSPDGSHFGQHGAASTSPIFSTSPNFWNQAQINTTPGESFMHVPDHTYGSFANDGNDHLSWQFTSPQMPMPMPMPADTSQFTYRRLSFSAGQNEPFLSSSAGPSPAKSTMSNQEPLISNPSVDPTMLYSFHNPTGASFSLGNLSLDTVPQSGKQQDIGNNSHPSVELKSGDRHRPSNSQHSRTNTASSGGSSTAPVSRPPIFRNKTDSGFRREQTSSTQSRHDHRRSAENLPPRRTSPLKRLSGQGSLAAIPETKSRPRTRLIIDDSGSARTITDPPPFSASDDRGTLKSQYPGLYADDDSSSEGERSTPQRSTSFAFSTQPRIVSKHARDDSFGRSSSVKKSRPASFATLQRAFEKPTAEELDRSSRRLSFGGYAATPPKSSHSTSQVAGGAQDALKRVVEGRHKRQENAAQSTLRAHNKRWSKAAADMTGPDSSSDPFTSSPTTAAPFESGPDIATPSTDRSSGSDGGIIRCACGLQDGDGDRMISCDSCRTWQHFRCLGLNPTDNPKVHLCIFCTGSTPIVRGGRVRDPHRSSFHTDQSPLSHKKINRR